MVNVARHVLGAVVVMASVTAMVAPALAHPIRRQPDLVLDADGNPIEVVPDGNDPELLIAKDPPPPPQLAVYRSDEPPRKPALPARNMLGFRIGVGKLSIGQQPMTTMAFGVITEARLWGSLRGFAEYEWLSLSDASTSVTSSRDLTGHGHRGDIGIRHAIAETTLRKALRFYIDTDFGGGVAWTTDTITGDHVVPHGLVGLRFGYDLITEDHDSPSREFECEFLLRTIIVPGSVGLMFGVGMAWGG
jgi:hypothetical protein